MRHFQLGLVLFGFGFITLTNSQCLVGFQNGTVVNNGSACSAYSDSILNYTLRCSGIPLTNVNDLKGFTDAAFDLYTLLRSRQDIGLVANSINSIRNGYPVAGSLSDAGFARLWFQLKLSPYLSSLSKETLTCLSQSSLSCQSFQALVQDLSTLTGLERKKMVYQNFIKSFLTRNTTNASCANTTDQDWLSLNFQTFYSFATFQEFKALKPDFNGLSVLNQLTPEQKAEMMFNLLAAGTLNNETVILILQSFLAPFQNMTLNISRVSSSQYDKNLTDFLVLLKPLGRFIRSSVNIVAKTPNITSNVTQLLNWTLSFLPQNGTLENIMNVFNASNSNDWLQYVFTPVVRLFLLPNQTLPNINSDITNIILVTEPQATDPVEICRVTNNNSSCYISQTADSVAKVINCVASSNLSLTESNLQLLVTALSKSLRTSTNQYIGNSSSAQSNLTALYGELPAESFTSGNLADVEHMKLWFQTKMIPLLATVPGEFLTCLSGRDFSCQVYRELVVGLSNNTGLMGNPTQRLVYTNFIQPFLTRRQNTSGDCSLPFNNSADFIQQNFGSFSSLAQLQDLYNLRSNFSALDVLGVLSPMQLNELVFTPPARAGDRNEILRRVFDFLLQASNRDKLNNFMPSLQTQARRVNFSCENYRNIFDRVDQTLSSVLPNQSEALLTIRDSLMMIPPDECIERSSQCTTTPVNETVVCANVNSSALDQFLNPAAVNPAAPQNLCNFTVLQFACLPTLSGLNAQQVADLLSCKLSSNVTKETWKLFFTKIGTQLDDALQRYSNITSSPSNVSLSDVLDVIVDVRINRLSPGRLRDPAFIGTWFQGRLKPFLPSLTQRSLSCLSTKNFTCESYRAIVVGLNNNTGPMNNPTQRLIYTNFIQPFLTSRQISGGDCSLPFNNSADFIQQNFGSFSSLAQLQDLYNLSRNFSALDVLGVLSPMQLNELVFTPPARAGDRNEILRRVFDFLLQASNRDKLNNFMPSLQTQARRVNFSCENYRNIFDRVDQTLSSVLPNQSEALLTIRDSLMMIPPDECIERSSQCTTTPVNETVVCANVNSSALDQFLNPAAVNPAAPQNLCNFTVLQFACLPTLSGLNAQQVADLLSCKLSSNVTKETWKLFFTKIGTQLDDALQRYSNMTSSPSNVSLSDVLDVIVDVRINRLSPGRLRDPAFIGTWFQGRLKPFLPSLTQRSLSCLSTKNFTCETYRAIVVGLNNNTGPMNNPTQRLIYTNFIQPFLTSRQISGGDCSLPFNNSADFIQQNFGSFSSLAQLQDLYNLSRNFSALDVLGVLSPMQLNELVFTPPARAGDRNEILRRVFDFLLQASNRDKLNNFMPSLQTQARRVNFSCENYRNIFDRVDQTLSSVLPNQSEALLTIRDSLMMIPPDECIERSSQCTTTPVNETVVCANVNSSALDQFLNPAAVNPAAPQNLCNFTVLQFACLPTLSGLNAQQVADLLSCKLSSNVTKETWKLFFTKIGTQLDDALQRYSNMTSSPSNVSLSDVLDVIVDVRINRLSPGRLRDPAFIGTWFQGRLKPFLPSLTQRSLSCLSTKNFTCETYRAIVVGLNNNTGPMNNPTQRLIYTNFIQPFLTSRQISGGDCSLPFNNSADFIQQNFGSFSSLAQLQDLYNLSRNFSALDVLGVLSPMQLNELVFTPPARAGDRNEILRRVFDFLLQASNRDKLNNFMPSLQTQARRVNFSCENYRNIFDRVDQTLSSVLPNQSEALLTIRDSLMMIPPDECIERSSQCTTTPVNETVVCANVNSSALDQFLNPAAVNPAAPQNLCNFTVLQFACLPTLSGLNAQQVADLLSCKLSSNVTKETWKLFFTKIGTQLDDALQRYSNMTSSPSNVSLSDVLDVIVDVRINRLSPGRLRDPAFIGTWFQGRLKPFLPSLTQRSLSCLSTKNLTCETYRRIVAAFVNVVPQDGQDVCKPTQSTAVTQRQDLIYTEFINAFLSRNDTEDPRCLKDAANSTQWLDRNLGLFVKSALLKTLLTLNRNFTVMEVLPALTVRQLAEFAATPGSLTNTPGVINIIKMVKDCQLGIFFDIFSPAVQNVSLTPDLKVALIRQIFERVNLTNVTVSNEEVVIWINDRLKPLLTNVTDSIVAPLFDILSSRDCNITQTAVKLLDGIRPSMPNSTKNEIYKQILRSFRGSQPLRCYRNNSFIAFLNESLLGFGPLPNMTTLLSLVPPARKTEIVNSIAPSELGSYLAQPQVVDSDAELCFILKNWAKTPQFLETVEVQDNLKRSILPCVWPLALSSNNQTEVDVWFERRLTPYLKFLNMGIVGSNDTLSASCLSYSKMVSVLGSKSFNDSQLSNASIYNTVIKPYLTTDSEPKCFNVSDTRINSTAWFVNYISVYFINFVSIDDLYSFGPENTIKKFSVNPDNIQLFKQSGIPKKVISRFTELIFLQNPNFNVFYLPSTLQCDAPASVFTKLNESQSNNILQNVKTSCSDLDPQISTALAGNIKTIDDNAIKNLGSESVGLTTVQINQASPSALISGLTTLSSVSGWSLGQAQAIITVILNGNFQLNSSSLLSLGSLIGGVPSENLIKIPPTQILETSRSPVFIQNIMTAPEIVQMTFVSQIIKVSTSVSDLMTNIPSEMALQIPRNLLYIPATSNVTIVKQFNNKKWKPEQAVLFFDNVADAFNDTDELSVEVLQGFTCSRVQKFEKAKIKRLINSCRNRQGRSKVVLSESQLTCMYNMIRDDSPLDFVNYPKDMLLYYNYETIPRSNCSSYFTEVGSADFSILSSELQGKRDNLWSNAQGCLNIVGTSIKKQDLTVLGNLACVVNKDYIENSDPEILENLKNCKDFSDVQMTAMETVLLKGTSKYGPQNKWNQQTLDGLGNLPLYFSQTFWGKFKENDLIKFLKSFLKSLRNNNTPKPLMKKLFKALIVTTPLTTRAATNCTKGNITSVEISDDAFPFGFDATQFRLCLSAQEAINNLAGLCEKIDDNELQRILLDKLNEISPNGLSESQVKVLGTVSRNATLDEISKWNITKSDTLAALMKSTDGEWTSDQSKLIITKYLDANNSLTATELNVVKGPNLCSLNTTTLKLISAESMKGSNALDVTKCSSDKKKAIFSIANTAFPVSNASGQSAVLTTFQLIETYLGGADLAYIKNLTSLNVSMSLATFMKLDETVVKNLTVPEVVGLVGLNLRDLKTYENQTLVRSWISLQLQSDLDKMNISLTGGRANTTSTTTSTPVTNTTKITVAATTSMAPGIRYNEWSFSFTLLLLIFTIIKVEIV